MGFCHVSHFISNIHIYCSSYAYLFVLRIVYRLCILYPYLLWCRFTMCARAREIYVCSPWQPWQVWQFSCFSYYTTITIYRYRYIYNREPLYINAFRAFCFNFCHRKYRSSCFPVFVTALSRLSQFGAFCHTLAWHSLLCRTPFLFRITANSTLYIG